MSSEVAISVMSNFIVQQTSSKFEILVYHTVTAIFWASNFAKLKSWFGSLPIGSVYLNPFVTVADVAAKTATNLRLLHQC